MQIRNILASATLATLHIGTSQAGSVPFGVYIGGIYGTAAVGSSPNSDCYYLANGPSETPTPQRMGNSSIEEVGTLIAINFEDVIQYQYNDTGPRQDQNNVWSNEVLHFPLYNSTTGKITFDLVAHARGSKVTAGPEQDTFSNFTQSLSNGVLLVNFTINFPNDCSLPISAKYYGPAISGASR